MALLRFCGRCLVLGLVAGPPCEGRAVEGDARQPSTTLGGIELEKLSCDFPRLDARLPHAATSFAEEFRHKKAVVLEGLVEDWPALRWSLSEWREALRDVSLPLRDVDVMSAAGGNYPASNVSGSTYLDDDAMQGEAAFAFSTTRRDSVVRELLRREAVQVPDLLRGVNYHPVASFGRAGMGIGYHWHGETWLALLHGKKLWFVREHHNTPASLRRRVDAEVLMAEPGTKRCVQSAAEIVYLPGKMHHATYNIPAQEDAFTLGVGGQGTAEGLVGMIVEGDLASLAKALHEDADIINDVTLVNHAAAAGQVEVLEWLLEHGAPVSKDEPPLASACTEGHVEVLEWLYQHRKTYSSRIGNLLAGLKTYDQVGFLGIHHAVLRGHLEVIVWLLQHRGKVDAPTKISNEDKPLHLAAFYGHAAVVQTLLAERALIDDLNTPGQTPLHVAASTGHVAMTRLLLDQRANIAFSMPGHGLQALHLAVSSGHAGVVEELLRLGAPTEDRSPAGKRPVDLARDAGSNELLELFTRRQEL